MKFGEYLQSQQNQEWKSSYLNYDKLKKMIKQLEEIFLTNPQNTGEKGIIATIVIVYDASVINSYALQALL